MGEVTLWCPVEGVSSIMSSPKCPHDRSVLSIVEIRPVRLHTPLNSVGNLGHTIDKEFNVFFLITLEPRVG